MECENLFAALSSLDPPPLKAYVRDRLLPFELEVFRARCAYWAGDAVGYLDEVVALMRLCQTRARSCFIRPEEGKKVKKEKEEEKERERSMWVERGARMSLIVASQLVEMMVRRNLTDFSPA